MSKLPSQVFKDFLFSTHIFLLKPITPGSQLAVPRYGENLTSWEPKAFTLQGKTYLPQNVAALAHVQILPMLQGPGPSPAGGHLSGGQR